MIYYYGGCSLEMNCGFFTAWTLVVMVVTVVSVVSVQLLLCTCLCWCLHQWEIFFLCQFDVWLWFLCFSLSLSVSTCTSVVLSCSPNLFLFASVCLCPFLIPPSLYTFISLPLFLFCLPLSLSLIVSLPRSLCLFYLFSLSSSLFFPYQSNCLRLNCLCLTVGTPLFWCVFL